MESFNDLLLKLREVHEQEVEGWQIKFQELSNKKGCDTKRMEELFTRNQQMKEQQRLLTDNIKTLENRLRAGLCDRCTVTQEVAKRREQEFEVSQLQSIQHITLMAGEITNLKMENKKLREEVKNLKVAKKALTDHSSSSTMIEVKPNNSPISSPSSGPVPLVTTASSRSCSQTSDGIDGRAKIEADQRTEDAEHKQSRGMSRNQFDSYRPLSVSNLASSCNVTRSGERRVQSFEGLDQRSPISAQALLLRNSPSSTSGEVNPSRHVLHSPVPCRPQPLRSHHVALPWPLSESPDWLTVGAAGTNQVMQNSSNPNLPRFPNLIPTTHHATPRRQVYASPWPRQGSPQPPVRESTVVFRLKSMSEQLESQSKPQEKKETQPIKAERVSGEGLREMCEGPLDLSDRGKSKSNQTARDDSPLALQGDDRTLMSPGKDVKINPSANTTLSLPSPVTSPSSSSTPPAKQEEEQTTSDQNHKQVIKDQEKQEEVNGKTEQSNEKKVPVLTISLRPVVVLETLKQDALSSNDTSSSPAANPESSSVELLSAEEESISEPESSQGSKRKRASVETETERDSDTENTQRERRVKITIRAEEKTPS